jgi:hypothetical protein
LTRLVADPCRQALALLALLALVLPAFGPVPATLTASLEVRIPSLEAGALRDLAARTPAQARFAAPSGETGQDGGTGPLDLADLATDSDFLSARLQARPDPVRSRSLVASPAGFSFQARAPPAA